MIKPNLKDIEKTLVETEFPNSVILEVIAGCNLNCIMCPQGDMDREKGEMKFSTFKKIVDQISEEDKNTNVWLAIMGEPLLLGDKFVDMIAYAKNKGLTNIHLNTNGCLLTPDISDRIIENGIEEVIIGIDAYTKETYEKIRLQGDFDELIDNIDYIINKKNELEKDKPRIIIQFIVMDENENELEDFKKYWLDKNQIVKVRPKLGWGTGVVAENLTLENKDRSFPCPWLIRTMSIHWNGNVAQCDADYEGLFVSGNVNKESLKEIWNADLKKKRLKHWNMDFDFEPCKTCKDWQAGKSYFYYPNESKER